MKFKPVATIVVLMGIAGLPAVFQAAAAPAPGGSQPIRSPKPKFYDNVAFDKSPTLRELAAHRVTPPFLMKTRERFGKRMDRKQ